MGAGAVEGAQGEWVTAQILTQSAVSLPAIRVSAVSLARLPSRSLTGLQGRVAWGSPHHLNGRPEPLLGRGPIGLWSARDAIPRIHGSRRQPWNDNGARSEDLIDSQPDGVHAPGSPREDRARSAIPRVTETVPGNSPIDESVAVSRFGPSPRPTLSNADANDIGESRNGAPKMNLGALHVHPRVERDLEEQFGSEPTGILVAHQQSVKQSHVEGPRRREGLGHRLGRAGDLRNALAPHCVS